MATYYYPYQNRTLDTSDAVSQTIPQSTQQAQLMKIVDNNGNLAATITPTTITVPTAPTTPDWRR